jgi:Flp pilus assembly protein TadD
MPQESLRLNEKQGGADNGTVHYHLGLAYQKANQPGLALQQLERAPEISPNNAYAKSLDRIGGAGSTSPSLNCSLS